MKKLACTALLFLACMSQPALAVTVMGEASAIVAGDTLSTNCTALNFGSIEPQKMNGEVVIFVQTGKRSAIVTKVGDSSYSRGICAVRGTAGRNYFIDVPKDMTFTAEPSGPAVPGAVSSLKVESIQIYTANRKSISEKGKLGTNGQDTLFIGGILKVPKNAQPGVYKGMVPVMVSY